MSTARTSTGLPRAAKGALAAILIALLVAVAAVAGRSGHTSSHDRAGNSWSSIVDSLTDSSGQ
jgi:hypothetical protein